MNGYIPAPQFWIMPALLNAACLAIGIPAIVFFSFIVSRLPLDVLPRFMVRLVPLLFGVVLATSTLLLQQSWVWNIAEAGGILEFLGAGLLGLTTFVLTLGMTVAAATKFIAGRRSQAVICGVVSGLLLAGMVPLLYLHSYGSARGALRSWVMASAKDINADKLGRVLARFDLPMPESGSFIANNMRGDVPFTPEQMRFHWEMLYDYYAMYETPLSSEAAMELVADGLRQGGYAVYRVPAVNPTGEGAQLAGSREGVFVEYKFTGGMVMIMVYTSYCEGALENAINSAGFVPVQP